MRDGSRKYDYGPFEYFEAALKYLRLHFDRAAKFQLIKTNEYLASAQVNSSFSQFSQEKWDTRA